MYMGSIYCTYTSLERKALHLACFWPHHISIQIRANVENSLSFPCLHGGSGPFIEIGPAVITVKKGDICGMTVIFTDGL